MICNNCGYDVPENEATCPQCGAPVEQPYEQPFEQPVVEAPVGEPKSKLVAGLLAIFVGTFGVHNFYLGFTKKAIIQLCIGAGGILLSACTLGITAFATLAIEVWAIIEGIQIFTGKITEDAKGIPFKD